MKLSPKQNEILERIYAFQSSKPFFLGGFAGTGKTTLLRKIEEDYPNMALFLAPTGKACQVLKTKLPSSAKVQTIHSLLYTPVEITDETVKRWEKEADEGSEYARRNLLNYRRNDFRVEFIDSRTECARNLIVVDESSMVGMREYRRLLELGKRLVFVGDPFQLPPVQSANILPERQQDFDGFLDEVHRAALESPITRLSMKIRSGEFYGISDRDGIEHYEKASLELLKSVDQVITGLNKTRWKLNRVMRRPTVGPAVQKGDKVILKENMYRGKGLFLVNGDIGCVTDVETSPYRNFLKVSGMNHPNVTIPFTDKLFRQNYGQETTIPEQTSPKNYRVDYAYAITCHSSQGSEWPSVLVYDDNMRVNDRTTRLRWLYTAVTRAKDRLVYVNKE